MAREPFSWVEIDVDGCSNVFGVSSLPLDTPTLTKAQLDGITPSDLNRATSLTAIFAVDFPATPVGVIWEQGGVGNGAYLGVTGTELVFRYGDGGTLPKSMTAGIRTSVAPFAGKSVVILVDIDLPRMARMTVYQAGALLAEFRGRSGKAITEWANTGSGAVGRLAGFAPEGENGTNFNGTIGYGKFYQPQVRLVGCTAKLGADTPRKCFNTYGTCRKPVDYTYTSVFRTLRYCQSRGNQPKGQTWWPVLDGEPSEFSATVNIAGTDSDLSAFGRRATMSVPLMDFKSHDRYMDPYHEERISGAAQWSGIGYIPEDHGSHFGRLKTRWPHYAGRPLRRKSGYLVNGVVTDITTRHYVITNMDGPDDSAKVTVAGSDVLDLADNKRTQAPRANNGKLAADITAIDTSMTLTPESIGDLEYPSSGDMRIGSEVVSYTRAGDVFTLTGRGLFGTAPAAHKIGDTAQVALRFVNARVDDVVSTLLLAAGIDPVFLPLLDWKAEVDRWLSGAVINRVITNPEGIKALISSLVPLGFSLWWDSSDQLIRLKANRPLDGDTVWNLSDRDTNLSVTIDEDDRQRVSDVLFWTVQKDPTKSATSTDNYARTWVAGDPSSREKWSYGSGEIKNFLCPWLDTGQDSLVRVAATRILDRFSTTPKRVTITLDAVKFAAIRLTDVIRLTTAGLQADTGEVETALYEIKSRSDPKAGERIKIVAQTYQFEGRFAYATPNDSPTYLLATEAQRDPGMFACDPITLKMPNGDPPYKAI